MEFDWEQIVGACKSEYLVLSAARFLAIHLKTLPRMYQHYLKMWSVGSRDVKQNIQTVQNKKRF